MNFKSFFKENQKTIIVVVKLLVFTLLCINIYQKLAEDGFKEAFQHFKNDFNFNNLWYILPVLILVFFNWGIEAWKWMISTKYFDALNFTDSYKAILIGQAVNQIVPAGMGDVAGRSLMHGEGKKMKAAAMTYYTQMPQKVAQMSIGLLFLLIALSQHFLSGSMLNWLIPVTIVDALIWYIPFFHTKRILPIIKRISFLASTLTYLEAIENFEFKDKIKLLLLSYTRWFVFTLQYVILSYVFFQDLNFGYYFTLCAVNFLLQSIIPSAGFLDLGIRGNLAFMAFEPMMANKLGILSVSYFVWIINLLIPSLIGYYFFWSLKGKEIANIES